MTATRDPIAVSAARRRAITSRLLDWYEHYRRDLPWRARRDPYAIWVSEVMLQQTQVATAEPYYRRWMQRFPTLSSLASATDDAVLGVWQGLGYYSRAHRLLAGARSLVSEHGGRLPSTAAELRRVPGIGAYSAGAIASIAFGKPEPAVDSNVARVLGRVECIVGDPKRAEVAGRLWAVAHTLIPHERPGDFNQALMELGATVCTPRKPDCAACPLKRLCRARREHRLEGLGRSEHQDAIRQVHMVAAVIHRGPRVLVLRQPDEAPRWAGLWKFPDAEIHSAEQPEESAARAARAAGVAATIEERTGQLRFSLTRHRITLEVYRCRPRGRQRARKPGLQPAAWKLPLELEELAMPAPHRRVARSLLRQ